VHKQVKGRKRHLAVDTLGLIIGIVVHSAGIQDPEGAKLVCAKLKGCFPRLRLIWADGAYTSAVEWVGSFAGWVLQIVKRPDAARGFVLLPRRWVIERTFAWLMNFRRLSRDYEETSQSSEAWIRIAMIHIMARRLALCSV
jgi:putative transposase